MANDKYELIGEPSIDGLRRIRALRDIGNSVKAGDVGGWVESDKILSFLGDA